MTAATAKNILEQCDASVQRELHNERDSVLRNNLDLERASKSRYDRATKSRKCEPLFGKAAYRSGLLGFVEVASRHVGRWPPVVWKDPGDQHFNSTSGNWVPRAGLQKQPCTADVANKTAAYSRDAVAYEVLNSSTTQSLVRRRLPLVPPTHFSNPPRFSFA